MQEGGDFILRDRAAVERGGDQRASGTCLGGGFKVADVAHAAGGVDRSRPGAFHDAAQQLEVGTVAGADAIEAHGNDPLGPMGRLGKQGSGPALSLRVEVERQHQALAEGGA